MKIGNSQQIACCLYAHFPAPLKSLKGVYKQIARCLYVHFSTPIKSLKHFWGHDGFRTKHK